jgi:hypothetical protein
MNLDHLLEIVTLSGELVEASTGASGQKEAAAILLDLIRTGIQAYQEHTGQPFDPSLVKAEAPL